ncbi:hypothetical protein HPB50_007547 [Hyalomma asiaticum]|uniref:Uncharacterized protein n=1 Tax=Hyalomma asiaticum TaxID=266040 RepID=A0ACB7RI76_HYAAI|nr:hypothetical protein HPB50_007547 [Hyalomma asiaticum]
MDLSMEEFIRVLVMGCPELLEDANVQAVFEDLKKAAPNFIKPATLQELKEAELAATAAQERYVAASKVKSALDDIQLLCYGDEDGPQPLIDKRHLPKIESIQAAIILSDDPIGRILGREELNLDQGFIDELHEAIFKHLQYQNSEMSEYVAASVNNADVEAATETLVAEVDGLRRSVHSLRLEQAESLLELQKLSREVFARRLQLPELSEEQHGLLSRLETVMETHNDAEQALEELAFETFGDGNEVGQGMQLVVTSLKEEYQQKLAEAEEKLREKKELRKKFDEIWCPEVEAMINEYKALSKQLESLKDSQRQAEKESGE